MNKQMHDVINKFHNINLRCGALALELESGVMPADDPPRLKTKIEELLHNIGEDLKSSRELLIEITAISSKKLDFYKESEHFFKVLGPILSVVEAKKLELENIINKNKGTFQGKDAIRLLHVIEEKALACGIILKELRNTLVKSRKYKIKEI